MKNDELTIKRFYELADRAYSENRYFFTDFLDMAGVSSFYEVEKNLSYAGTKVSEGERCVIRFGSEELCGYDEPFPIDILHIEPVQKKFAEELTHRDFLGSVLGLGIERSKLGDIIVKDSEGYIFVVDSISDYIIENLLYVRKTKVKISRCDEVPEQAGPKLEDFSIMVSSNRLDGVISKVFGLSRDESVRAISDGRVFINGRSVTGNSRTLKENDVISVRGLGRFIFAGEGGLSKKGKTYLKIRLYQG